MNFSKLVAILALLVIGSCIAYADEIPTTTFINTPPNITSISFGDNDGGTIQLSTLDDTLLNCTGTVVDLDGYADIDVMNASIFGPSSTANSANSFGTKYSNNSCLLYGGSGNTTSFECTVVVHHHTEPGTWQCNVAINDSYQTVGYANATNTVDVFKSIAVPLAPIDFGSYALGQDSGTTDFTVLLNNSGNVLVNFSLDTYRVTATPSDSFAMACTNGDLPVSAIRFSNVSGVTATSKTSLADAPTTVLSLLNPTAFGGTAFTNYNIYFGIVIPSSGQTGTCNGFIDISAQ